MNLNERLDTLLNPAFRDYASAESELSEAIKGENPDAIKTAREKVILAARQAASELHQFSDAVDVERPRWLPSNIVGPRAVQQWVQKNYCQYLRNGNPCEDMDLLHDIQDAIKHVKLKVRNPPRRVSSDKATVSLSTGYGQLPFGEGKYGGAEQMVVTLDDGRQRALSSVLQNSIDAWRAALGAELPPINN